MNLWTTWLALPLTVRLMLLALTGLLVGGQINRGIYRLAWHQRWLTPWAPVPIGHPRRTWFDRVPVLGWWLLRRESRTHGRGFWLRGMLIELATAAVFAGLYWWEVDQLGLIPRPPGVPLDAAPLQSMLHAQCFVHLLLYSLLMVATFIDFDEKTIPDAITVTGTLAALGFMGLFPEALLPTTTPIGANAIQLHPLWAAGPPWPGWFATPQCLSTVLACYAVWCFGLLDKRVTLRRGWWRGATYLVVSIYRRRSWQLLLPVFLCGTTYLVGMFLVGGVRWQAVASSVLGLAMGGGIIWGVRIVGRAALGVEAMGFGDVTLMAMIGAVVGWQASVIVFFLAPVAAVVIAVAQWLATRSHYIAFGPYLSLAAMVLIVGWTRFWTDWLQPVFESLGNLIPALLLVCLLLMGLMLWGWRLFRENVLGVGY